MGVAAQNNKEWKLREQQTIQLEGAMGSFMKLSLEAPHPHSKNLCSQVRKRLLTPHSSLARESPSGWVAVDGFSFAFFSLPQVGIVDIAVDGELDLETSTRVLKAGQEGLNFTMLTHGIDLDEDFINSEAKMEGMGADAVKLVRSHASRQESVIQFQFNSSFIHPYADSPMCPFALTLSHPFPSFLPPVLLLLFPSAAPSFFPSSCPPSLTVSLQGCERSSTLDLLDPPSGTQA